MMYQVLDEVGTTTSPWAESDPKGWQANHSPLGILVVSGKGVRPAVKLQGVVIEDIAPTILHALNAVVPDDLDGRILTEVFSDAREPQFTTGTGHRAAVAAEDYTVEEREMIEQRLRDLGYLS